MCRADQAAAAKMPLGFVPAGTGNGIVKSLLSRAGEELNPVCAVLSILRARLDKADVGALEQEGQVKTYSILSLSWGLIADVDIQCDRYRFLGESRVLLQAAASIVKLKSYKGRLQLLCPPAEGTAPATPRNWKVIDGRFVCLWAMNMSHAAYDLHVAPEAQLQDGCFDVVVLKEGISRGTVARAFMEIEKGTHIRYPQIEIYKAEEVIWEPSCGSGIFSVDGELSACGPETVESLPKMHKAKKLALGYEKVHLKVLKAKLSLLVP
mmetsp:Transcript_5986/g.9493  ORF Transcript_5986/g.9493 Transcript_5986/m.9493 type:complete len:266 (+) Transcript_5986:139-936(+)